MLCHAAIRLDQTGALYRTRDPAQEDPMKAIVQNRYGSADVLELREIDKPVAADDEVLVRFARLPSIQMCGTS